ncbi:flagellar FliJ protein [Fictibacillus solisalsi]|uniref:Flagellar FliJ protein n=1 Tax=Fictibacillus solisalsi TaxID=459525 RepID=A0A1G9UXB6_9BACL|nr:flagellar export protein FliJ [Fictibacillus solisalsi]SDM64611.1 flagellar FliJ protein [Fictibacillus solisalsi]
MAFQFNMEKLLSIKTKEKEVVQSEYGESVKKFEQLAQSLYELLKKKEEIEQHSGNQFKTKMVINEIQQTQRFLLSLTQQIGSIQTQVQRAREKMNHVHIQLLEKTMEVKKFEKMKERQFSDYQQSLTAIENKQNDEYSILRYINH